MANSSELTPTVLIALGVSLMLFVAEGINYSQLAPFFPNEAELRKGLTEFQVGAISSCFDFSTLIFSAFLPLVAKPELNKFFFISGTTLGAVANMCFGVLGQGPGEWWYASMCFFSRIVMGIGAGMLWSTGVPLLTTLAPSYAGRITSLIESGVGVGIAIGPPIGSGVYSLGGYMYPFLVSGAIELVFVLVAMATVPSGTSSGSVNKVVSTLEDTDESGEAAVNDDCLIDAADSEQSSDVNLLTPKDLPSRRRNETDASSDNTGAALSQFLSYPGVWLVSLFFVLGSVPFGLFDVALSPYLLETFNVDGDTAGLFFLSMGALYAIFTQFVGYAVDKGYAVYIFFWSTIATVINSFLFSAPYAFPFLESKYFVATILAVDGVALSGTFVPVYLILEHIVMSSGFRYSEDSLKLVIGIWINFTMAAGRILGSVVFGGVIYPHLGFYITGFITSVLFLISTTLSNGYLIYSKNYKKIYYVQTPALSPSADENAQPPHSEDEHLITNSISQSISA
ncbi:MFS-type transporter SLC18B1-like [Convolutriloba macropyga]|uniref:MFS-type transporter SLC18B1-like n=1 Tax=Convolutriloba macropyga TaxID=536237 RepID=UPI003F51B0D0